MVCRTAHTGTLPGASEGFWMTLGECMKFQSRQMGRSIRLPKQFLVFPNTAANTTVVCVPLHVLLQSSSQRCLTHWCSAG